MQFIDTFAREKWQLKAREITLGTSLTFLGERLGLEAHEIFTRQNLRTCRDPSSEKSENRGFLLTVRNRVLK